MGTITNKTREAARGTYGVTVAEAASEPRALVRRPDSAIVTDPEIEASIARREEIGYGDSMLAGFLTYNTLGRAVMNIGDPEFPVNLDFNSDQAAIYSDTPNIRQRITNLGHTEDVAKYLGDAVSEDHYEFLLTKLETESENSQIASEHFTAMLLSTLLDPVDLTITAASGGAGLLTKARRVQRMLGAAVTAGVGNASIEAIIAAESPFVGKGHIAFAAAAGFVLGGAVGSLGRNVDAKIRTSAEKIAREARDAGAAARYIDEAGSPENLAKNATENQGITRPLDERDFRFEWLQKFQRTLIGRTFFSASRTVQDIAGRMMEGGHLAMGKVRNFTAEGRAEHVDRMFINRFHKETGPDFKAWVAESEFGVVGSTFGTEAGRQFYTDVVTALRGGTPESPHAATAAAKIRPLLDEYWLQAQRAGVKGFEGDPLPNYVPRMYDYDKWIEVVDDIGEGNLVGFFRENLLNSTDLSEELAEKIARGMVRSTMRRQAGMDQQLAHGIPLHDMDELRKFLDPIGDTADARLADEIVELLEEFNAARVNPDQGNIRFAQKRIQFDELYPVDVKRKNGKLRRMTIADLTENDGRKLLSRYSRVMSGHIGMAREAGILSRQDFDNKMQAIRAEATEVGGERLAKVEGEIEALETAYRSITGQSLERDPFGTSAQVTRTAMGFTYLANGGMFGLAQIPEFANAIAEAGIATFIHYVPEFGRILKRAQNGELVGKLARDIDQMIAPGTDFLRNPAMASFDDAAGTLSHKGWVQNMIKRIDPALRTGTRAMTGLNMMAPINASMQRFAAMMTNVKYASIATGRRVARKGDIERLRANGIDAAMEKRIYAAMRESSEWKNGKLDGYDVGKWNEFDSESLDAWNMHNTRSFRQMIQENDVGNQAQIFGTTLGKMMTQFRTFTFQSVNKQLMHGVNHMDVQQGVAWSTAMFLAAIVYVGRTGIEYASDPKELEARLTPQAIAAAAVGRSGAGSIIPMIVDTPLSLARMDPIFSTIRSSGLASSFIGGNPVISMGDSLARTAFLPIAALSDDYEVSQADMRRIARQLPYSNLLGVRNALSVPFQGLPETSKD